MAPTGSLRRTVIFVALLGGAFVAALLAGYTPYAEQMNRYAYDWFFRLRGEQANHNVAVVAIDEDSISRYGWPLDRSVLARTVERICAARPSALGIDLLFTDVTRPEADGALADALRKCPNVVLAARLDQEELRTLEAQQWAEPLPEFAAAAAAIGHAHPDPDEDGFVRRILLAKSAATRRHWALALETFRVQAGGGRPVTEQEEGLKVGERWIPAPPDRAAARYAGVGEGARSQRTLVINFAGGEEAFARVTLRQVLEGDGATALAGKPVLLGVTADSAGVSDRKFTPFSVSGRDMAGVVIHANALHTLMTGRFLLPVSESARLALLLLIAAAVGVALYFLRGTWLALALAAVAVAVHGAPYFAFSRGLVLLPVFSMAVAFWLPVATGGAFQYATVWRYYMAADAASRRLRGRLEMVSHEMRTPLAAIQGSSELMGRYALNEDRRKQLTELIHRESQRLARMVERFLDVERLEAGEIELRKEAVPLAPLVDRTLERIQPLLQRKNIRVRTSVNAEPSTLGDSELLEFALYNLVSNAVKYSPESSTVEVTVRSSGKLAYLDVRDEGVGIAPEDQARIFDRFFRTDAARQAGQPGLGLGLSIVREIARHHGGSVLLESRPGEGSRFSLALPLANGQ